MLLSLHFRLWHGRLGGNVGARDPAAIRATAEPLLKAPARPRRELGAVVLAELAVGDGAGTLREGDAIAAVTHGPVVKLPYRERPHASAAQVEHELVVEHQHPFVALVQDGVRPHLHALARVAGLLEVPRGVEKRDDIGHILRA